MTQTKHPRVDEETLQREELLVQVRQLNDRIELMTIEHEAMQDDMHTLLASLGELRDLLGQQARAFHDLDRIVRSTHFGEAAVVLHTVGVPPS